MTKKLEPTADDVIAAIDGGHRYDRDIPHTFSGILHLLATKHRDYVSPTWNDTLAHDKTYVSETTLRSVVEEMVERGELVVFGGKNNPKSPRRAHSMATTWTVYATKEQANRWAKEDKERALVRRGDELYEEAKKEVLRRHDAELQDIYCKALANEGLNL